MSFSKEHDEHCPTCGEPVPSDYVEQGKDIMEGAGEGEDCTPTWSALIRSMYEAYATACIKIAIDDLIEELGPFPFVVRKIASNSALTKLTDKQYLNACEVKGDLERQFNSLASGLDSTNLNYMLTTCAKMVKALDQQERKDQENTPRLMTEEGVDITEQLPYKTQDFRGDAIVVLDFEAPNKPSSTGRIHTDIGSFFPSVAGLKIEK